MICSNHLLCLCLYYVVRHVRKTWERRKQINLLQTCSVMATRDQHCNSLTSALYSNFLTSEIIVSLKNYVFYCLKN